MPPQQNTLDERRHSELFEGFVSPEEFRRKAKPGKRPPPLRTFSRGMDGGMGGGARGGDQRLNAEAPTPNLLRARVRQPERDRRRQRQYRRPAMRLVPPDDRR